MFEGDQNLDPILAARRRLDRADVQVELMRSILGATRRGTPSHEMTLRWLHELERSRFCRALELDGLMKERREHGPAGKAVRNVGYDRLRTIDSQDHAG